MDEEITKEELQQVIDRIEDRYLYLYTKVGASQMFAGKTARELCAAYRILLEDLKYTQLNIL